MKLEVGMYVRTNKGGIGKITFIQDKYVRTDSFIFYKDTLTIPNFFEEKIIKASHTLLGNDEEPSLIEAGDYVNGHKVLEIYKDRIKFGEDGLVLARKSNYDNYYLYVEDIKTIVTREQFEQMQYKVGD